MKLINKIQNCFLIFTLLSPFLTNSQGVTNTSGSQIIIQGTAFIIINNAGFQNDGIFTAGAGTVAFTGSSATSNSFISGAAATGFNNLTLDKTTAGMQLNCNISVSGTLLLQSGDSLYLNNYNIDFGSSGVVSGETSTRKITANSGGYMFVSQNLNSPSGANPGNLGVEITSSANLGNTVVRRGHQQQSGASIGRYYDIIPTNNSALAAQIKFYYFPEELAGIPEGNLAIFSSSNGGVNWSLLGQDEINTGLKYVAKLNVSQLYRLTLADVSVPLPVELLYFNVKLQNSQTHLNWATATEQNNRLFEVQRSTDGGTFNVLGFVTGAGNSYTLKYYNYIDVLPVTGKNFYRLRQVDVDGRYSYSKIGVINNDPGSEPEIAIKPNPVTDKITVTFNSLNRGSCIFEIYSMGGKLISNRTFSAVIGKNIIEWDISQLPAGIYVLKVQGNESPNQRFMKQ